MELHEIDVLKTISPRPFPLPTIDVKVAKSAVHTNTHTEAERDPTYIFQKKVGEKI